MDKDYDKVLNNILSIKDKLGKQIDPGIRHAVAALHISEINTNASCEGHLHRGLPYPWIDVDDPSDRKKLDSYINIFYKVSCDDNKFRLRTVNFGSLGGCRLMSYPLISDDGIKDKSIL